MELSPTDGQPIEAETDAAVEEVARTRAVETFAQGDVDKARAALGRAEAQLKAATARRELAENLHSDLRAPARQHSQITQGA